MSSGNGIFARKAPVSRVAANAEHVAMRRLANDLLMATPLILIGCVVLPTTNFIGYFRKDNSWVMRELQLDGLAFP